MISSKRVFAFLSSCGFILAFAATHDVEAQGASERKLVAALTATASGKCPEEIMSPLLLDACEQQISNNSRMLSALGKIQSATYRGMQELGNGVKAEAYRVDFEQGRMTWFASLDAEGRLLVLWSTGQVVKK